MSVVPLWEHWKTANPAVHAELERLASAMLEAQRGSVVMDASNPGDYAASAALGLVRTANGSIAFTDEALRDQYIACVAIAQREWNTPKAFAENLAEVQHRTGSFEARKTVAALLVCELATRGIDVLAYLANLAALPEDERHSFWDVYHAVSDALAELQPEPTQLVDVLATVLPAVQNDLAGGLIFPAVEAYASRSRVVATRLVDAAVAHPVPDIIPTALVSLSRHDFEAAHSRALALVGESNVQLRAAGILALATLPYPDKSDGFLEKTLRELDKLGNVQDGVVAATVVRAHFNLLTKGLEHRDDLLIQASTSADGLAQYTLAHCLFRSQDLCGETWWQQCLINLGATPLDNRGTYRDLDWCGQHIATRNPTIALGLLQRTAEANRKANGESIVETFAHTVRVLAEKTKSALELSVTDWFRSDDQDLNHLASAVVHNYSAGHTTNRDQLRLSSGLIRQYSTAERLVTLRHVCGLVIGGAPLAALVSSIAATEAPDTLVQRVTDALVELALYNYPKGAGEYLRYVLAYTVFPLEASTARRALEQSRRYYDRLADLPELTELRTPASRRYLLHLERVKTHERIRETAREESDFMRLVHTITLKHGRASFDTRNGIPSTPQPLHSFSYEVELPRGESIDPIGQRLRRLEGRMARVTKAANSAESSAGETIA